MTFYPCAQNLNHTVGVFGGVSCFTCFIRCGGSQRDLLKGVPLGFYSCETIVSSSFFDLAFMLSYYPLELELARELG